MKLDRTLLDKGRAPTVEEMKDYFKKNDYTTAPPTFDPSRAKVLYALKTAARYSLKAARLPATRALTDSALRE